MTSDEERAASSTRLVTLCRLRPLEADLAKAKLEGHGISCFLADRELAAVHPLIFSDVRVQVRECDAAQATELLSRPIPDDDEGEYVDEDWRCPSCHRKSVDLLPLSRGWRASRAGCLTLLVTPPVVALLLKLMAMTDLSNRFSAASEYLLLPWLLVIAVLSVALLFAPREKQCRECGHSWSKQKS